MGDLDDEFQSHVALVNEEKNKFSTNEQNIIDAWLSKLTNAAENDGEKVIRNEYSEKLARFVNTKGELQFPFNEFPSNSPLEPLEELKDPSKEIEVKPLDDVQKFPCTRSKDPRPPTGAIPKSRRLNRIISSYEPVVNEFEDPEEMAKVIARSKGQTFAEFVVAISRHTRDFGQGLRQAMKAETTSFKEYVDHVLSQRIKDLTEVLDDEQNTEILRIKKDTDKWVLELNHCKRLIKEMVPSFDLDAYKKDKNYLKKIFTIEVPQSLPNSSDSFKKWREESVHRLKWYNDMVSKLSRCNDQMMQEISNTKAQALQLEAKEALKQQNHAKYMGCAANEYQKLRCERDKLQKENAELLMQLEEYQN